MHRCFRLALLVLLVLIGDASSAAAARSVEVARLEGARADASFAEVHNAPESAWVAADAIRRQSQHRGGACASHPTAPVRATSRGLSR
jgi:hypothetical protein